MDTPAGKDPERQPLTQGGAEVDMASQSQFDSSDLASKKKVTWRLILAIFSAVLGMFTFGYNTGVMNNPQAVIKSFFNETYKARHGGSQIPDKTLTLLWAFTVAIFAIGGMVGGGIGGWWADRLGRKIGMMTNILFGISGGLAMALSREARSYELIIIGRFVIGFHCGLCTSIAPLYNSEISPDHIRGAIGTMNQLAVTIGLLLSQVVGLEEVLGNQLWPLALGLTCIPPALQLLCMSFSPESPRFLIIVEKEELQARSALEVLRGTEDVTDEIEEIRQEQSTLASITKMSMIQLLCSSRLRLPLMISLVMHMSQQLTGIVCIFYYSESLFEDLDLDPLMSSYATLAVGGIMVMMTIICIPLMDRAGRRTLHLTGLGGMFVFSIFFTLAYTFKDRGLWLQQLSVITALVFVVFFALGPGSIPWLIVSELFSQGPRPAAVSLAVLVNWASNFIVGQAFPPMQAGLKSYVFLPFTAIILIFFIFLFIYLPETKGKTIEEIVSLFSHEPLLGDEQDSRGTQGKYRSLGDTSETDERSGQRPPKVNDSQM